MVRCQECGTENENGSKYCQECGCELKDKSKYAAICTECGMENPENAKHCTNCGASLKTDGYNATITVGLIGLFFLSSGCIHLWRISLDTSRGICKRKGEMVTNIWNSFSYCYTIGHFD